MKLWLIWQNENNDYDTFDSAVVAAETEEEARYIYPGSWNHNVYWNGNNWEALTVSGDVYTPGRQTWTLPKNIKAKYLGDGYEGPAGAICSSFNAG